MNEKQFANQVNNSDGMAYIEYQAGELTLDHVYDLLRRCFLKLPVKHMYYTSGDVIMLKKAIQEGLIEETPQITKLLNTYESTRKV